jgi:hypothetical protein
VKLDEFRNLVRSEFGQNLKHATPGNVREFLDRIENEVFSEQVTNRIVLNEPCTSYEEVIKDFFTQMLELPPEEAVVGLWALALDLAFASIESQYTDRFSSLFKDME